jgi:hypothetical protein
MYTSLHRSSMIFATHPSIGATSFSPSRNGLLQRKCACGGTPGSTGECEECRKKRLQRATRKSEFGTRNESSAPPSVYEALRSPGQPLDTATRAIMEQHLAYDFSRVRLHTGAAAEQSAQAVNANAYTVGHNIVFGHAQFAPGTDGGRRLLAHELAHVMQQGARAPNGEILIGPVSSPEEIEADRAVDHLSMTRRQGEPFRSEDSPVMLRTKPAPVKKQKSKIPLMCGRRSRKVAGNSITKVNLDVGANTLTIEWQNQTNIPPGSGGTHSISPGAGLCCKDCNDDTISQTSGSLCTPKGSAWPVDYTGCELGGHPSAKNPTYFQRRGVAIHSGNTSSPPQSHGCARTSVEISELIHDNVVQGQTMIASSGTWAGKKCYMNEAAQSLSNRKDVCDGDKLKSPKKDKKRAKQSVAPDATEVKPAEQKPKLEQHPLPVTEALPEKSDELRAMEELEPDAEGNAEMIADGPGPNNEPASHETIDQTLITDLDLPDNAGDEGDIEGAGV